MSDHGTNAAYVGGCRCEECRESHAAYRRHWRTRTYLARAESVQVDGTGTRRRLRALQAAGWTLRQVDDHLDRKPSYAMRILGDDGPVYIETAAHIARLYDQLANQRPPTETDNQRRMVTRNRNYARARGWLPLDAWLHPDDPTEQPDPGYTPGRRSDEVDPVVVERILAGDWALARDATVAERDLVVDSWAGTKNELERLTKWNVARYGKAA